MALTLGYSTNVDTTDLIVWLDAGNTSSYSSGSTWTDLSGNSNNCVFGSTPVFTSGTAGYFSFNGSSHYGTITKSSSMDNWADQQTVIMLLRHSYTSGRKNPWDQAYGGYGTWTHENGDNINQYFGNSGVNGSPYVGYTSGATTRNQWNLIVGVRDQISHKWYINGSLTTTSINPYGRLAATAGAVTIGNGYAGFWQGDMAAVLAYKRALTDEEIVNVYSYYSSRYGMGATGLVFSEGSAIATSYKNKGALISIATFASSGTYTVPSNCSQVYVQLVGGGGGAAGYCESGGAGGYAEGAYPVTPGSQYTVTVGGGGTSIGYYAAAGNGGSSSFGSLISASGGYGANQNYSHGGGQGGVGSGGQVNIYGGSGTGHSNYASHNQGSAGGGSYFGGPGSKSRGNNADNNSPVYGSGASGGITEIGSTGAAGKGGLVIVYAYK